MTRKKLIAGNWKLHNTLREAVELAQSVHERTAGAAAEVALAPVFTALSSVRAALASSHVALSAQDVYWEKQGAFTGGKDVALLQRKHVAAGGTVGRDIRQRDDREPQGERVPQAVGSAGRGIESVGRLGAARRVLATQPGERVDGDAQLSAPQGRAAELREHAAIGGALGHALVRGDGRVNAAVGQVSVRLSLEIGGTAAAEQEQGEGRPALHAGARSIMAR